MVCPKPYNVARVSFFVADSYERVAVHKGGFEEIALCERDVFICFRQWVPSDVSCVVAEFADVTFEEFRDSRLLKGEQNCSATEGNHVLTSVEVPETVCYLTLSWGLSFWMSAHGCGQKVVVV